jgi:hypothetical protein
MLMYGASPVPVAIITTFWPSGTWSNVNMPVILGESQIRSPILSANRRGVNAPEVTSAT